MAWAAWCQEQQRRLISEHLRRHSYHCIGMHRHPKCSDYPRTGFLNLQVLLTLQLQQLRQLQQLQQLQSWFALQRQIESLKPPPDRRFQSPETLIRSDKAKHMTFGFWCLWLVSLADLAESDAGLLSLAKQRQNFTLRGDHQIQERSIAVHTMSTYISWCSLCSVAGRSLL